MTIVRTREVFDATAAGYGTHRAKLIPGFASFYGTAVSLVPEDAQTVLDLGAGTGLMSALLRDRLPTAELELMDNSEPMLAQAREHFANDPTVQLRLADYTSAPLPAAAFDAVVSALSIHHLEDAAKRHLFGRIHDALRPGGVFVNAEQILAPTPALEEGAKANWLAQVRALGATEDEIAASLLRQTEDRCATVADQLEWMGEAGFEACACAFAEGRFAVLHAQKVG